ncbi:hypothetical protein YQE_04573, partial [Dendroctonus ponderosae]
MIPIKKVSVKVTSGVLKKLYWKEKGIKSPAYPKPLRFADNIVLISNHPHEQKDPRGHTNLGAMLHLNGKYKEAEHSYKKALKLQPDDETTLTNLHRLYGIMT